MPSRSRLALAAVVVPLALCAASREAEAAYAPSVAIVLCEETYNADFMFRYSQMSSQALVGLAGLVGVPYDTITFDELLAKPAGTYSSVWFSTCQVLSDPKIVPLQSFLLTHLDRGGSVLLDGPIGIYQPPPSPGAEFPFRGSDDTADILNVEAIGYEEVAGFTVRTASGAHPLSALPGWAPSTTISQGLAYGTDVIGIADASRAGSSTLLELGSGTDRFPFLVATQPSRGRVLAISSYANDAGAATPFRNEAPAGFFDNLVLPRLLDGVGWLLSPDEPFVGLQLSHAPMTVVARLDGDQSDDPDSTAAALDYLVTLGHDTGVATMYGIVSSFAASTQWDGFLPLLPQIEPLGGAIASHSATHDFAMSDDLVGTQWDAEVRDSLTAIRNQFTTATFHPPVKVFINPGGAIRAADYRRFFGDIETYATQGDELSVPYTTGISGFALPTGVAPVALLGNAPVPDVQWLYDEEWSYHVAEATQHQKEILGYYQNRVGRGVLYHQMWHDYAIAGEPPLYFPAETNVRALHDASRDHFAKERVYAPAIDELTAKLHLAQRARVSSTTDGAGVTTAILDLSQLASDVRARLAGMGLRLNRAAKPITSVTIDGTPHPAFTDDTVVLPSSTNPTMSIQIKTGNPVPAASPRLTYLSKAFHALSASSDGVHVELAAPGLFTRFCAATPSERVVLGADRYAPSGSETCGVMAYGASSSAFDVRRLVTAHGVSVDASDRRIAGVETPNDAVVLSLAEGAANAHVTVRAATPPTSVVVGGTAVTPATPAAGTYDVVVAPSTATTLTITFPAVTPPPPPQPPNGNEGSGGAGSATPGGGSPTSPGGGNLADGGRGLDQSGDNVTVPGDERDSGCHAAPGRGAHVPPTALLASIATAIAALVARRRRYWQSARVMRV